MDRIELYVHTNMSDGSGINTATEYIKKQQVWAVRQLL